MVPDRVFNLLSDLRGELLALEAEPRGMEKYLIEELGQWYTLHMPRPPVHVSRVKITGGSTTPMAVPMRSQVTQGTNTTVTMRNLREQVVPGASREAPLVRELHGPNGSLVPTLLLSCVCGFVRDAQGEKGTRRSAQNGR